MINAVYGDNLTHEDYPMSFDHESKLEGLVL